MGASLPATDDCLGMRRAGHEGALDNLPVAGEATMSWGTEATWGTAGAIIGTVDTAETVEATATGTTSVEHGRCVTLGEEETNGQGLTSCGVLGLALMVAPPRQRSSSLICPLTSSTSPRTSVSSLRVASSA